ncbi:MAG TPA: peptide deformylase [Firmicutes bacterium]|nr:peptide deformylase [Bacillota bacterium]
MALRKILTQGDPALSKVCRPVEKFDQRLHTLLDDMKETLAQANGLGLAASQVGILRRVVVVVDSQGKMVELVNPVILRWEGEQTGLEGCLSVPGQYGMVTRPYKAVVQAQDRVGNRFEMEGEGVVARCFFHELEHLDGHLFVERTDRLYTTEELDAMEQEDGQA